MNVCESLEFTIILKEIEGYAFTSIGKENISSTQTDYHPLRIAKRNAYAKEALSCITYAGTLDLSGIKDLRTELNACLKGRTLTSYQLLDVLHLLLGIQRIKAYEAGIHEIEHPEIKDLISSLTVNAPLEKKLKHCINDYGEVSDNASEKLSDIRRQLHKIDGEIAECAMKFMDAHSASVVDRIVTKRNDRTVILVKASDKNAFGGYTYGDSQSGLASYIEPAALVAVNNKKNRLQEEEATEVEAILKDCSAFLRNAATDLISSTETIGLLDEIFAKARWGYDRNGVVACLNHNHEIEFIEARHPLIDKTKVVPNDYHLSSGKRMLLITGPNTGGKTVSLKIIGLFTLLTYAGIPVLCQKASVPYLTGIYADIGDDQSVASSYSSFSYHVSKQAEALRHADENTLILLDEVGSGTDPKEGESLAISILNTLRKKQAWTVVTTHYSRLKAYGKRHEDILVASVSFDEDTLQPTYHFVEGVSGNSNALIIAEKCGLDKEVIHYARFLMRQSKTGEEELLEKLDRELEKERRKNAQLDEKLKEIEAYQKELEKEKLVLQKKSEELDQRAFEGIEAIEEEAKKRADRILKEMRSLSTHAKYHEVLEKKQELETGKPKPIKENEAHETYAVNETVELKVNGALAKVKEVRKKELLVEVNGREMRIKPNQVRKTMKVLTDKKPEKSYGIKNSYAFETYPIECNLIGMRLDEARETFLQYIDGAKVHHLELCRIVHGNGSGALRKMVYEELKKDKDVLDFHSAMPNQGGSGATVVKFNVSTTHA